MVQPATSIRPRHPASAQGARGFTGKTRPDRGVCRKLRAASLGGLLVVGAATSEAQSPVKQVLVLQSLDRGGLSGDAFTSSLRTNLDRRAGAPVNIVQVVVGQTGFVGAPEQAVVDYIRSIYADRPPPDLIVTISGPAAVFARKHRGRLFPTTPLLFASVDQRWLRDAPLGEMETAVAVVSDFPRLIDDILQVLPETRHVFMVTGSGSIGRFWRRELEIGFARFRNRVTFIWSDELSYPEVLRRSANLPAHSAIVYLNVSTDARGGAIADAPAIADLHAGANAPLFGAHSPMFGMGIVGGSLMSIADLARRAADVANRILDGESPASLRVQPQLSGQPMYDWRELQRWNIPESRLPTGSVVQFRAPSLWSEHKAKVLTAAGVLVLQSFLITLLLYERRARQRAEIESRRNLALAADTNRRETISALTTSIGHELGQPLSAITHNAQALQLMVAKGSASDATGEIVADIEAEAALATQIIERHRTMLRSHELKKKPIDLHTVIEESLALVAHDMRARQVEVTLDLSSTPCVIDGDQVLLQQVLVNLVRNAVDALAETPLARRHITIRSAVRTAEVEVSVSDTGAGLPAGIIGTLFTPFVTTKSHGVGIGLTIAQRIVAAHGGTIAAHENHNGGATFTVTLPRSASPGLAAAGPA